MRYFIYALIPVVAAACSTSPSYDPNAREAPARVVGKKVVGSITRETAEVKFGTLIPVGKAVLPFFTPGGTAVIPVYEYAVMERDRKVTTVLSEAPVFEIGQCVKLFNSDQPSYPRIAYDAECRDF